MITRSPRSSSIFLATIVAEQTPNAPVAATAIVEDTAGSVLNTSACAGGGQLRNRRAALVEKALDRLQDLLDFLHDLSDLAE